MKGYVLGRLASGLIVIFLALTAVFFMLRLSGDPVLLFAPMDTSKTNLEEIRERMGFNEPLAVQYATFMGDAIQGDFGESTRERRPAIEIVLERLPATLQLGGLALVISLGVGIPLGILSATHHGSVWDKVARLIAVLGQAIPGFWLGVLLMLLFAVQLNWLPTSGRGGVQHIILPAITLSALSTARYARLTRSTMLDVLGQDYMRTAKAKGLSNGTVLWRHALKNASISLITMTGLEIGRLIEGAVVIEQVFAWPGMGRVTVQALLNRDFAVVMAAVVLFAAMYTLANLVADLAYGWANPQVKLG
ncbi:MAG TPA: ABC transporter permease [Thermomicrobiales bacterium]|nr:ABC transporter permease [Thermomicrobiales bacterium]